MEGKEEGWSLCHVFFISADGFKCLLQDEMGGWKEQSGVPGSAAEREGTEGGKGRERRALPARRYKRCSVFTGERERDEGKSGHCLT